MKQRVSPVTMNPHGENPSIFDQIADTADSVLQSGFKRVGYAVGSRPLSFMLGTTLFSLVLSSGLLSLVSEDRTDKLWIPQDTQAKKEQEKYEKYFPAEAVRNYFIAEGKTSDILTRDSLLDLMDLHTEIRTATIKGGSISLDDLCIEASKTAPDPCFMLNPLEAWAYNRTALEIDGDILGTLNDYYPSIALESLLGKEQVNDDDSITSAKTIKVTYFLKDDEKVVNNEYVSENNDDWEEKFLDIVQDYKSPYFKLFPEASRSLSDEFGEAISNDVVLINIAFMVMIIYLSVNLGQFPCMTFCPNIHSRVSLSFGAIVTIVLAMGAGFGLASYCGFKWTPVHGVLPFVVLGLGVDDSFVITNAFDQTSRHEPIPERMAMALGHAASSITVTSLTDFVAFAISTTSALPALSSFCIYAAFTILFLFMLQVTFFAGALCLDEQRTLQGHMDVFVCCTDHCTSCATTLCLCCEKVDVSQDKRVDEKPGRMSNFLRDRYAPLLVHPIGKAFVIAGFSVLLGVCIWGATQLTVESSLRSFVPDGSYLLDTFSRNDKYYGTEGADVFIVTREFDYFSRQDDLLDIQDVVHDNKYLLSPSTSSTYDSWYESYLTYCNSSCPSNYLTDEDTWYEYLHRFLAGPGAYYNNSVVFDGSKNIIASRIEAQFKSYSTFSGGRKQEDADKVVKAMNSARQENWGVPAFPWSFTFLLWETFAIIKAELITNVSLCLVAVFVITFLLIGHPMTSFLVSFVVTITVLDILGCMYFWGMVIDNVTVIQAVIAIGLCVDYAAHVGHSFMLKAGTRDERVVKCLSDIGAAVLNGGFSTFLAVVLLAASRSYVFRVLFQQFFLTVVLGLGHGIILLPVLLSLFGPRCYASVAAEAVRRESKEVEMVNEDESKFSTTP